MDVTAPSALMKAPLASRSCHLTACIVAKALDAHREDIERGALLSIDEAGARVRVAWFSR